MSGWVSQTENGSAVARFLSWGLKSPDRVAVVDGAGEANFGLLSARSTDLAAALLAGKSDLNEQRVAFLATPSAQWVIAQWAILAAGGIAVPLLGRLPDPELAYILDDSDAGLVITDEENRPRLEENSARRRLQIKTIDELIEESEELERVTLPLLGPDRGCMILYTSGSTGEPKGVVWTHGSLTTQLSILHDAWGWEPEDVALLALPLHHVHGIVNVLGTSLWTGARCRVLTGADPETIWQEIVGGDISVFMAVPTIYHRLVASWDAATSSEQRRRSEAAREMRLMVSGSAALPVPVLERWRDITGHTLLARYGMTELGMVLSNPLSGERIPGAVGKPLPTVQTRIVDDDGRVVEAPGSGHLHVRGPSVFREYWNRPEASSEAFVDGWFLTGDVVAIDARGVHRILGRDSVDIIKTGGEKVSALEVEDLVRAHEAIAECAVVGIPDVEWGERVAAVVVTRPGSHIDLDALRAWARPLAASYKIPSVLIEVDALPRNAMGKVVKPHLADLFDRDAQ
jgi:malonyl-CoA/methylmalonyl-CoA synthetase